MCLCCSASDAKLCPICARELEYKDCTEDRSFTLYYCPNCDRNYEFDQKKDRWVGITTQILLLTKIWGYSLADASAMRPLIFEMMDSKGSIQQDSLILNRALGLLQEIQARIPKHIQEIKERIQYQEKIKPMSRMQKRLLQKEKEELL